VGDQLVIGGPRGSRVVPDDFDWYLFIGDETALPALGRWIEQLRPGVPVTSIVLVANTADQQPIKTAARHTGHWVVRSSASEVDSLREAIGNFAAPSGDGFIWIAAEAMVARKLRDYFCNEKGHPKGWMRAAGYWKRGTADVHETIED
jgi:NADPH-dependent ferric siderophore reductase